MQFENLVVCLEVPHDFRQEPGAAFGLVDPILDQAGRGNVIMFFAHLMGEAQETREFAVVGSQIARAFRRGLRIPCCCL